MLYSDNHLTLRLLWNLISGVKNKMMSLCAQRCCGRLSIKLPNSVDNYCVSRFEVTPVFLLFNNLNPY